MRSFSGRHRLAPIAVAVTCSALFLAGCGEDEPDSTPANGTDDWQSLDACALLTDDEAAAALAIDEPLVSEPTSQDGRPGCSWTTEEPSTAAVEILLWAPPLPDALTEDAATVPVGDRTGYVQGSNDSQCFLQVEGDPFWVSVDLDATDDAADPDFCANNAAPVAEMVFEAASQ